MEVFLVVDEVLSLNIIILSFLHAGEDALGIFLLPRRFVLVVSIFWLL